MAKYQEVRQCVECGKIYPGIYPRLPYICYKCGTRLLEDRKVLFETEIHRTDSCRVVIAKRGLFGWKVKESEG